MNFMSAPVSSLKEFNKNPRKGNIAELKKSLTHNKQYRPIVVQKSTRQILAGNHLWKAAKELGWENIDIVEIDVSDEKAKQIVLADNKYADLGNYDTNLLSDLLGTVDYEGTGYTRADYESLLGPISSDGMVRDDKTYFENVVIGKSLAERASTYADRTERLLMCEYSMDKYQWINQRLLELRTKYNVNDNSSAVLQFLAEYTESDYPK